MPRSQRNFSDDEIIHGYATYSVLPFQYDQEGEDEAVGAIEREGCLHPDGAQVQS